MISLPDQKEKNMDKNAPLIRIENLTLRSAADMRRAAQWWARNAWTMPDADPWKSHLAMVPLVALNAESPRELVQWLRDASACTGHQNNCYDYCAAEFLTEVPPWDHVTMRAAHDSPGAREVRRTTMSSLLREIREDAAISVRGTGLLT